MSWSLDALRTVRESGREWRRRAAASLLEATLSGLAASARLSPAASAEAHGVEVLDDVPYADDGRVHHRLDVYRPLRRDGPLPALLYMHGGGFCILSKESHWRFALDYARRGFVVFNVNYRLAPAHPFPAAVEDCAAAYAWVVARGAEYGADATRLVLAGESAGANLITALTVAACYERPEPFARELFELGVVPRAVLPACGILQVSSPERFRHLRPFSPFVQDRIESVSRAYLGGAASAGAALADPLLVLEGGAVPRRPLPPFFAPVGTRDVLLDDTRRLERALARLGTRCEARYYPGEIHAFHALPFRPAARLCWEQTFAFLSGLGLTGPAG